VGQALSHEEWFWILSGNYVFEVGGELTISSTRCSRNAGWRKWDRPWPVRICDSADGAAHTAKPATVHRSRSGDRNSPDCRAPHTSLTRTLGYGRDLGVTDQYATQTVSSVVLIAGFPCGVVEA
jgi:hypothetical protein